MFQLKQGCYADLPAAKISEMMKSNSLDVSFVSLFSSSVVLDSYHLFFDRLDSYHLTKVDSIRGTFAALNQFQYLFSAECPNSVSLECGEWNSR